MRHKVPAARWIRISTPTATPSIYSHVVEGNESAAMDVLGRKQMATEWHARPIRQRKNPAVARF
jgi:hypothetical protein